MLRCLLHVLVTISHKIMLYFKIRRFLCTHDSILCTHNWKVELEPFVPVMPSILFLFVLISYPPFSLELEERERH